MRIIRAFSYNNRLLQLSLLMLFILSLGNIKSAYATDPTQPGIYPIGYTKLVVPDTANRVPVFSAVPNIPQRRMTVVDIWYPAAKNKQGNVASYNYNNSREQEDAINQALLSQTAPSVHGDVYYKVGIPSPLHALVNVSLANGQYPLIIHSHGGGNLGVGSFKVMEMLASHGFIVVSINHSDIDAFENNAIGFLYPQFYPNSYSTYYDPNIDTVLKWGNVTAPDGILDIEQTINLLLSKNINDTAMPSFKGHINASAIGATGWSMGACNAVILASGVQSLGIAPDPRIKAIAPWETCYDTTDQGIANEVPFAADSDLKNIKIPMMLLYGTDSPRLATPQPRAFVLGVSPVKYKVTVLNATHGSFGNNLYCDFGPVLLKAIADPNNNFGLWDEIEATGYYDKQGDDSIITTGTYEICPASTLSFNIPDYNNLAAKLKPYSQGLEQPGEMGTYFGYTSDKTDLSLPAGPYNIYPTYTDTDATSRLQELYVISFFKVYLAKDLTYLPYITALYTAENEKGAELTACVGQACVSSNNIQNWIQHLFPRLTQVEVMNMQRNHHRNNRGYHR